MRDLRWSFRFLAEDAGGIPVVVCFGRMGRAAAEEFARALRSADGCGRLVIDLSGVDYVSSAALFPLEAVVETITKNGGPVAVCGLSVPVRLALDLAGILSLVTVTATRDEALQRLSSGDGT